MDDQIGSELNGPAEVGCCKRRVDQEWQPVLVCKLGKFRDIEHLEAGVAQDLTKHELGVWPNC